MRVSYVNTYTLGSQFGYYNYNEVSANLGVRLRESTMKNSFELLRFGVVAAWTANYTAYTLTVGYRF